MPAKQHRFLPDPQPLVERLGVEFFRSLPERPGVYLMHGSNGEVLYVGKARSLKNRLNSYRTANPDRVAVRTLRLLHQVVRIELELCETENLALHRESELLLQLKPKFNRAGIWRGPDHFIAWRLTEPGFEILLTKEKTPDTQHFGPLESGALQFHRALVRLAWCRCHPKESLSQMPYGWFHGGMGPSPVVCIRSEVERPILQGWLERTLLERDWKSLEEWKPRFSTTWETEFHANDLECVSRRLDRMECSPAREGWPIDQIETSAGESIKAAELLVQEVVFQK